MANRCADARGVESECLLCFFPFSALLADRDELGDFGLRAD